MPRTRQDIQTELDEARERRDRIQGEMRELNERADGREFNDGEQERWERLERGNTRAVDSVHALESELRGAVASIGRGSAVEGGDAARSGPAVRQRGGALVGVDEVYRRGSGYSYFADLVASRTQPTPECGARLARHGEQMDRAIADGTLDKVARKWAPGPEPDHIDYRVAPNTTDGQGGYFSPPLWLVSEYVDYARAARATADLCRQIKLPVGTGSINLPRVTQGTKVDSHVEGGGVATRDLTDDFVEAKVRTLAGQLDYSIQLHEQSAAPGFDEVVMADLQREYNMRLGLQVIAGTGAGGQTGGELPGILNVSGVNAITYTDASPTLPELWSPIQQAASKIASNVFMPPEAAAVHPARWYWGAAQLDTANRPLLGGAGPQNAFGNNARAAEHSIGDYGGLPAVGDANIPTSLGTGTNEDRMIIAAWNELLLWEGTPRVRVLLEVLSGTLQVRVQLYNFVAFMPQRRPKAISVISGTGLAGLASGGWL